MVYISVPILPFSVQPVYELKLVQISCAVHTAS